MLIRSAHRSSEIGARNAHSGTRAVGQSAAGFLQRCSFLFERDRTVGFSRLFFC